MDYRVLASLHSGQLASSSFSSLAKVLTIGDSKFEMREMHLIDFSVVFDGRSSNWLSSTSHITLDCTLNLSFTYSLRHSFHFYRFSILLSVNKPFILVISLEIGAHTKIISWKVSVRLLFTSFAAFSTMSPLSGLKTEVFKTDFLYLFNVHSSISLICDRQSSFSFN